MKEDIKNIKDTNSFAKLSDDEAWLVDSNSKNIVIFNTQNTDEKKYIIKSSEVHLVKEYNLDYMRIAPNDK